MARAISWLCFVEKGLMDEWMQQYSKEQGVNDWQGNGGKSWASVMAREKYGRCCLYTKTDCGLVSTSVLKLEVTIFKWSHTQTNIQQGLHLLLPVEKLVLGTKKCTANCGVKYFGFRLGKKNGVYASWEGNLK